MTNFMYASILAACAIMPFTSGLAVETRMATIDMKKVVESSSHMEDLRKSISEEFTGKRDAIVKEQESLKKAIASFKKNQVTMKKSSKEKAEKKLLTRQETLAKKERSFQTDLYQKQEQGYKAIMDKVKGATKAVAEKEGYSIIIPSSEALYSSLEDITERVQSALSK